jgi:hypothetical protein
MMMNWRGFGRKRFWPNFKVLSQEGLRKTMKSLIQSSRLLGPRIELGTSRVRGRSVNHSTMTFGKMLL